MLYLNDTGLCKCCLDAAETFLTSLETRQKDLLLGFFPLSSPKLTCKQHSSFNKQGRVVIPTLCASKIRSSGKSSGKNNFSFFQA